MFESGYVVDAGLSFGQACCLMLSVESKMAPLSVLSKFCNYSFFDSSDDNSYFNKNKTKGCSWN